MRGNNVLKLNQATLIEAVQEYLDRRTIGTKQIVESVTENGYSFYVEISESQDGDHAAAQD